MRNEKMLLKILKIVWSSAGIEPGSPRLPVSSIDRLTIRTDTITSKHRIIIL